MVPPIRINRAPVLTLWAAVVAERLGFDRDEALSPGRAVAGLNAQSKGRRLGVFKPHEVKPEKARDRGDGGRFLVEVCGRDVPATVTPDGVRAVTRGKAVEPARVEASSGTTCRPCGRRSASSPGASRHPSSRGGRTRSTSGSGRRSPRGRPDGARRAYWTWTGLPTWRLRPGTRRPPPARPGRGRRVPGEPSCRRLWEAVMSVLIRVYSDFV